ncbi:DUF2523 domain-containing protein [Schlegelella sp. S2-27]|uniref:DUF2523 domain-containing protein n=1 Tax=Caldimonas mangrovi TaxID=2944811 RepID=A0ABT0YU26_9BURK|nr:DUF2523 family protein [Caldimonas mangrovi]MCM5681914.1 DUF2523 domain-containing protein [Caldimonas mangrovi]
MPVFIAALLGGLIQAAGTLVGRVLISLGFGYVTFTGLDTSLTWLRSMIAANFGAIPAQGMAVLSGAGAGSAVSIVLSAIAARMLLDGLTGGTLKKMVLK